jgi:hypothetical protein
LEFNDFLSQIENNYQFLRDYEDCTITQIHFLFDDLFIVKIYNSESFEDDPIIKITIKVNDESIDIDMDDWEKLVEKIPAIAGEFKRRSQIN